MSDTPKNIEDVKHQPTEIGVKCLNCSLHFTIWSWYSDRHDTSTIYCPECGQHNGNFMVWKGDGTAQIFTRVPGKLKMYQLRHMLIPDMPDSL